MNANQWIRQFHRWVSIAFTVAVIINIVALMRKEQAVWIGLLALLPLILLLVTGLYLFALPYASSAARGRRAPHSSRAERESAQSLS
jgi:ATP/ADP translocase